MVNNMNREIKFRAWDKEYKQMWFDVQQAYDYIDGEDSNNGEAIPFCRFNDILKDKNWIVMQYIGLKDNNGVDIYEGDIVKFEFDVRGIGVSEVKWNYGEWNVEDFDDSVKLSMNIYSVDKIEVIGNIYQNKELLK